MDLTTSYNRVLPADLLAKYQHLEVRNAAAVLKAADEQAFDEVLAVLDDFYVYDSDILVPGGNRGPIPIRLDGAFARLGWIAVRINTVVTLIGKVKESALHRKYGDEFMRSSVANNGFEVDNMKRRVALDVEWNAKDGNLDRDLSAYRALYDFALIDVAVMITRDHFGIQRLAGDHLQSQDAVRRLGTSTTTNMHKLRDRLTRGDSGGCPVWAIGIGFDSWAGRHVPAPDTSPALADFNLVDLPKIGSVQEDDGDDD